MKRLLVDLFLEIGQNETSRWVAGTGNLHRFSVLLYCRILLDILRYPEDLPISAARAVEMRNQVLEAYKKYRLTY
jgi:hypothetical protein